MELSSLEKLAALYRTIVQTIEDSGEPFSGRLVISDLAPGSERFVIGNGEIEASIRLSAETAEGLLAGSLNAQHEFVNGAIELHADDAALEWLWRFF